MSIRPATALIAILVLAHSVPAVAQDPGPYPGPVLELNVHGGLVFFDIAGTEPAAGARVGLHFPNGLGFAANVDRANRSIEVADDDFEDATTWFYVAEANYTIPSTTRANFIASIGVGGARFEPPPADEDAGAEATTELVIPLGLGLLWYNYGTDPNWAFRIDFRDHIVHADEESDLFTSDDSVTNNYEISLGVSLLLGR